MFVPHKPLPFRNEWHKIFCSDSGVLFRVELVEGKDAPAEQPPPSRCVFNIAHQKNLYITGKIVVLDIGFYVLQAFVDIN